VFDTRNKLTGYVYDDQGRQTRTNYPDSTYEETAYDFEGRRTSHRDRAGNTTTYEYDELGRQTITRYADNTYTESVYNEAGQVSDSYDELRHRTHYEYDAAGRQTSVTRAYGTADAQTVTYGYDSNGNQVSQAIGGNTTTFEYDALNRRTKTIYPDSTYTQTTYDVLGRRTKERDQEGKETAFEYNPAGQLIAVYEPSYKTTRYSYDAAGNQITQTDTGSRITTYTYDNMGRRLTRTLPMGQVETYVYNPDGSLKTKTNFNNVTTSYTYDDNTGRLTEETAGSYHAQLGYDNLGRVTSMADNNATVTQTWDAKGRLATRTSPAGTNTYTYQPTGQLQQLTSSLGGSLTYGTDNQNRYASVKDSQNNTTLQSYDASGNLYQITRPNGITSTYTYNTLNRLTTLNIAKISNLASFAYTLAADGKRTGVVEANGRSTAYVYDTLNRLTQETVTNDPNNKNGQSTYYLDGSGNRTGFYSSIPGVSSPSTTYDANDRATNCTWDNAGNMLADAAGNTYEYDPKNRLTKANKINGDIVEYIYDYQGNLIAKEVNGTATQYNVDVNNPTGYAQVFEEAQNNAAIVRYTYCTSLVSQSRNNSGTWNTSYYLQDGHGNVRMMADESGAVTDTVDFDAFGQIINHTGNTPNEFLYCAERQDPNTGLYFLRSRWMDAGSGRFVGMDGFEGRMRQPSSLHKYLYCASEPVNSLDPSGRDGWDSLTNSLARKWSSGGGIGQVAYYGSFVSLSSLITSPAGMQFTEMWEGHKRTLYNDSQGHCTIGVGHLVHYGNKNGTDPSEKPFLNGLDDPQVENLFAQDLAIREKDVRDLVRRPLTQAMFDALVDFVYQRGRGTFVRSDFLAAINNGQYYMAGVLLQSRTDGGWARRGAEGMLYLSGIYPMNAKEYSGDKDEMGDYFSEMLNENN
jgi:RHS repeat-associated protein